MQEGVRAAAQRDARAAEVARLEARLQEALQSNNAALAAQASADRRAMALEAEKTRLEQPRARDGRRNSPSGSMISRCLKRNVVHFK